MVIPHHACEPRSWRLRPRKQSRRHWPRDPRARTGGSRPGRAPAVRRLLLLSALAAGSALPTFPPFALHAQEPAVQLRIDAQALARDVAVLAADSMEGRRVGTRGSERARTYLLRRFEEIGLRPVVPGGADPMARPTPVGFAHDFTFSPRGGGAEVRGVNLLGAVPGTERPERVIVVTAHYDHLGIREGEIFNGADDNASGTAGLLALATYFRAHPPRHSILFAALDAEEAGLQGARALVGDPPLPRESIAFNVNLDMVGRNAAGELYVAGTYHRPALLPLIEAVAAEAPVRLLAGHDRPDLPPGDDWTSASDHGPFHAAGIPFLYFGVEDHPDYHQPTDDVAGIQPDFHARAVETVLEVLLRLDREDGLLSGGG